MKLLTLKIKHKSDTPIYRQLYNYILTEIMSDNLTPYEKLPSRRCLSEHLQISKNTVDTAYQLLVADGYVISMARSGFYVAPIKIPQNTAAPSKPTPEYLINLSVNDIDISHIPYNKWSRASKNIHFTDPGVLAFGENYGELSLRKAIAKFLKEMQSIHCSAEQIVIGAGAEYLLHMLDMVLGNDNVYGFENPCYLNNYEQLKGSNSQTVNIDINANGLDTAKLYNSNITTMYVMPEHQMPIGYTMDDNTRSRLLEWAASNPDKYILEDSYDSFYQYSEHRSIPLFSMDTHNKVIYLCSFSRILAPSIRLAFLILPEFLLSRWRSVHRFYRCLTSKLEQSIILQFIELGYLTEHISNMNKVYKSKRNFFITKLKNSQLSSNLTITNIDGGTHFLITFHSPLSSEVLRNKAIKQSIYWKKHGLIINFLCIIKKLSKMTAFLSFVLI